MYFLYKNKNRTLAEFMAFSESERYSFVRLVRLFRSHLDRLGSKRLLNRRHDYTCVNEDTRFFLDLALMSHLPYWDEHSYDYFTDFRADLTNPVDLAGLVALGDDLRLYLLQTRRIDSSCPTTLQLSANPYLVPLPGRDYIAQSGSEQCLTHCRAFFLEKFEEIPEMVIPKPSFWEYILLILMCLYLLYASVVRDIRRALPFRPQDGLETRISRIFLFIDSLSVTTKLAISSSTFYALALLLPLVGFLDDSLALSAALHVATSCRQVALTFAIALGLTVLIDQLPLEASQDSKLRPQSGIEAMPSSMAATENVDTPSGASNDVASKVQQQGPNGIFKFEPLDSSNGYSRQLDNQTNLLSLNQQISAPKVPNQYMRCIDNTPQK